MATHVKNAAHGTMTRQFWHIVAGAATLFVAVSLLLRVTGRASPPHLLDSKTHDLPPSVGATLLMVLVIYLVGRLLVRTTGSDRVSGFLGLYGIVLYLPLLSAFTGSITEVTAVILVLAALLDILDTDVTEKNALRAGLYLSFACLLNSGTLFIVILLLPVVALIVGARWRRMAEFVVGALVPLVVVRAALGLFGWASGRPPVPIVEPPADPVSWVQTVIGNAGMLRILGETQLFAVYAAFGAAAAVAVTGGGAGISRRCVATTVWLLLGLVFPALGGIIDESAHGILIPLAGILLLVTANAGLSVFVSAAPPDAERRWIVPLGAFFLLPSVVSLVRHLF